MGDGDSIDPATLRGARVQRVDTPRREVVVLEIRWPTGEGYAKGYLVCSPQEVVLTEERPRGEPVDGFGRRLRKLLTGAWLEAVEGRGPSRRLRFERGPKDDRRTVVLGHENGEPVLRTAEGRPLAGRSRLATRALEEDWEPVPIRRGPPRKARPRRSPFAKAGKRRRAALRRTIAAVERDIARVEKVDPLRERANVLKAHAHQWTPGMDTIEVVDFHADPPASERWAVDPQRGPSAEADALFHRARRFERGAAIGTERLETLRAELAEVEAWLADEPSDEASIDRWEAAAPASVRPRRAKGSSGGQQRRKERLPYRRFLAAGSRPVLVGRGAADNDQLTLRHSRPWDLWLHAKGRRGAHVIVPLSKREDCPPELLADAAMLAAHFSDAAGDAVVDVSYVPRRHVHKRKGDPPGAVRPSREKVIAVRMEPARIRSLVAAEQR